MSIEKVTQERLDIAQKLKNELEEMKDIQEESGDLLSKQLGLYKDAAVINKDLLAKESLKRNVSNDFAKQQLKTIQGQNIIRKNVAAQLGGFKKLIAGAKTFNLVLAANPVIAIGAALVFVLTLLSKINKALAETRTSLGVSAVEAAKIRLRVEATGKALQVLGLEADDAQTSFNAIRETFGGIDQASSKFVFNLARAQLVTGATTSQIADLLAIQESVTSASRETLLAQLSTVSAAIRLEGVAPDAVFRQLAENAEAVALSINDGGDNLIRAAIQARKLGIEFRTVTGIADKLLDFESSIESQLEASVLLGREINLDRARQLALNNDLAGALEEVVTQVGGEAEFNELNRIQRQALADSVGVSVQELSRLVRDNANAGATGVAQAAMTQEEVSKGILAATIDVVKNTERGGKASETVARFVSE
tara:strand:- start:3756 stop:5027 length:1272 start_codon:yes stop_codon:yes gene_type:complete